MYDGGPFHASWSISDEMFALLVSKFHWRERYNFSTWHDRCANICVAIWESRIQFSLNEISIELNYERNSIHKVGPTLIT